MSTGLLVERDRFLAQLESAHGSGRVALVSGEAGIGKTALVRSFIQRLPAGARVWWGGCDPLSTPRPLGPIQDIAHANPSSPLADLLARGAPRDALFATFLDHLRQAGGVAVLEDVHWADEATLDLLRFVGRRIEQARGLLIATFRDDEVGPTHPVRLALGHIPRSATLSLPLPPLSPEGMAALAARAARSADGLEITNGNPFFITEILADPQCKRVPVTVRDAVMARVARCSLAARRVLDAVSVVPARLERWLLAEVVGRDIDAVDECIAAGVLVAGDDETVAFRHELARLSVCQALTPARLRDLHARVLHELERHHPDAVARLAHHAVGAQDDPAVLRYAAAAGDQASRLGAHCQAATHFGAALARASRLPPAERAELLEKHSFELYLLGDMTESVSARREALQIWLDQGDQLRAGSAMRWMSRLQWFSGRRPEAERWGAEAIRTLEALPDPGSALAMAYSNRSQLAMLAEQVPEALHWGARAIELAERLGDFETLAHALNNVGAARCFGGDPGGYADLERSLSISLEHGLHEHTARAFTNLAATALQQRNPSADEWLRQGIEYARERDLDAWVRYLISWRARLHLERGGWAEAAADASTVVQDAASTAPTRVQALAVLALLQARRGEPDSAGPLDEARALALLIDEPQRVGPVASAMAEIAWLDGDRDLMGSACCDLGDLHLPWDRGAVADFCRRIGVAPPSEPLGAPGGTPYARPYGLLLAGDWRGAADLWAELGFPYNRALALAAGDDRAAIREARAILAELGATATIAALARDLKARGVRGLPRGPRARTQANPAGLTARQLEVLALLTQGLRNGEIADRLGLSARTADHHVSAILSKLGARTRAEATIAATRLGIGAV